MTTPSAALGIGHSNAEKSRKGRAQDARTRNA